MITFDKFIEMVTLIVETREKQDQYMTKVPDDLVDAVFYNEYVNLQCVLTDRLMDCVFGTLMDDVVWYLYEKPNNNAKIVIADKTFVINTLEDFFAYIEEVHFKKVS